RFPNIVVDGDGTGKGSSGIKPVDVGGDLVELDRHDTQSQAQRPIGDARLHVGVECGQCAIDGIGARAAQPAAKHAGSRQFHAVDVLDALQRLFGVDVIKIRGGQAEYLEIVALPFLLEG